MTKKKQPQAIRSVLDSVLKKYGYLTACLEHEVIHRWPSLVGERVAAVSSCTGVENGTLFVHVSSAPWRQEISFMKGQILQRIRSETRCTTITDIVFH